MGKKKTDHGSNGNGNGTAVLDEEDVAHEAADESATEEASAPVVGDVRVAEVTLLGLSPYSPSRAIQSVRGDKEGHDEFDTRCFRERAHKNEKGNICIPGNSLYLALLDAASYRGEKFKGMKTYFSLFERGVSVLDHLAEIQAPDPIAVKDVKSERLYLPSDGVPAYKAKGKSSRVWRTFPIVYNPWTITLRYLVLDGRISEKVFENHLKDAGMFIGLGRFRPACRGTNGRFHVESVTWRDGSI